jgi:hypothetical protein
MSIHILYNHSPAEAPSSLAGQCEPLINFNCPEVVETLQPALLS